MASMGLGEQFHAWVSKAGVDPATWSLIEASDEENKLIFTVNGKLVTLELPRTHDSICLVDTSDPSLVEWSSQVSNLAFERPGISVTDMLDLCLRVWERRNKKAKISNDDDAAATAVAIDVDAEDDGWGDDEDGFDHGDGGGEGAAGGDDGWGDDDGGEEDGNDGWGEFEEDTGDHALHGDQDWERWRDIRKRWKAKEEELRAQEELRASEEKLKDQIFSSKESSQIITNCLIELMQKNDTPGMLVEPVDANIFTWRVRFEPQAFSSDGELYRDLRLLEARYGREASCVELELSFLMDLYPFYPPKCRLVRPRLKHFLMGRIVCMEELQVAKWNPVCRIEDVINSIRRLLDAYGAVDDQHNVNDPTSASPPYTASEFQLLRLSMLTETPPRVLHTLKDAGAKDLPSIGVQNLKKGASAAAAAASSSSSSSGSGGDGGGAGRGKGQSRTGGSSTYWAKGTGYGFGSQSDWDINAWKAAQAKKDNEIQEICSGLLQELRLETIPPSLPEVLGQSCLVPFLEQYLSNDSVTDMERHERLYRTVFSICAEMVKHPECVYLFARLPEQKRSLHEVMIERQTQAQIVHRFGGTADGTGAAPSASSSSSSSSQGTKPLNIVILETAQLVESAMDAYVRSREMANPATTAAMETTDAKDDDGDEEKKGDSDARAAAADKYVRLLKNERFAEVEEFSYHMYMSKRSSVPFKPSRAYMRRLATEYADLAKSLPLTYDSSIFLRVHESSMAYAQMLIIAPDETPYGRGAFTFDVYFPSEYPGGPPKVLLQTTGGNTVRFNPNLYDSGKVCLSLLGTWQGQQGESWNSETSTFLQVCVSIQSLIFVPEPYFNEPGYERSMGTPEGNQRSLAYNSERQIQTIRWAMVEQLRKPPRSFEKVIRTHFTLHKKTILDQCEEWLTKSTMKGRLQEVINELKVEFAKLPDDIDE